MMEAMYLHVPFCDEICAYCDFTRCKYHRGLADKWLMQMEKDLSSLAHTAIKTIYIGGGTPSSLSLVQLEALLSYIKPFCEHVVEYTMEANAESLSDDKISLLASYGVNRISMGAQSFDLDILKCIERKADLPMIKDRIAALHKAGIDNISIDLMYALPMQSLKTWERDLQTAASLAVSHISLYALTIEEHSKFGRNKITQCDESLEADMYELAMEVLQSHDFEHYEISSFAKAGKQSKHNMMYWNYEDFYGIGCGASGKVGGKRYDNTRNLHTYIGSGSEPTFLSLSQDDQMFEMLMMSLRVKSGICEETFFKKFSKSLWDVYGSTLTIQIEKGMLVEENGHIHTTKQGMMFLNDVLTQFL